MKTTLETLIARLAGRISGRMTGRPATRRRRDPYRFELGLTEDELAADLFFGRD